LARFEIPEWIDDNLFVMDEEVPINLPKHIAIIPDGNRRWAKSKGLPAFEGHKRGYEAIVRLSEKAKELGIKYLTVWFFSTENWARTKEEVSYLMDLALEKIDDEKKRLLREETRFTYLGRKDRIPKKLVEKFTELENITAKFDQHYLNLAFDYGGRDELIQAIKGIVSEGCKESDITEELISNHLYTKNIPDPDLIIRTSGEKRLSGYLPWQGVYSELYFADVHCPDFNFEELKKALLDYSGRERRKGGDSKKQ
jgi:undecaprenyl diphosphate synthase